MYGSHLFLEARDNDNARNGTPDRHMKRNVVGFIRFCVDGAPFACGMELKTAMSFIQVGGSSHRYAIEADFNHSS